MAPRSSTSPRKKRATREPKGDVSHIDDKSSLIASQQMTTANATEGREMETATAYKAEKDNYLRCKVNAALAAVPGGENLDIYFGISTGRPLESDEDARSREILLKMFSKSEDPEVKDEIVKELKALERCDVLDDAALRALRQSKKNH